MSEEKDPLLDLLVRYRETTNELRVLHREMAQIRIAEARAKAEGWRYSEETTVAGRERSASLSAVDLTCDRLEVQGNIDAANEEKDYLSLMIRVLNGSDGS